jgi:exopolysaccharide production protein ExoQ
VVIFKNNPAFATGLSFCFKLSILFFLVILLLQKKVTLFNKVSSTLIYLTIFITYAGLSIVWSEVQITTTLSYYIIMVTEVFIVFLTFCFGNTKNVFNKSINGFIGSTVILALFSFTLGIGEDGRLGNEELLHPNTLANHFSIALLFCIYCIFNSGKSVIYWIISSYLVLMLTLVLSKTSLLALQIALFTVIIFVRIKLRYKLLALVSFLLLFILILISSSQYLSEYISARGGERILTLTGRTLIWEETWLNIIKEPIIGHGFFSFREYGPQIANVRLVTAHNEILNLWFNYGIIGVIIVATIYGTFLSKTIKLLKIEKGYRVGALSLTLFVYFIIRSITEAHQTSFVFLPPLILLLVETGKEIRNNYVKDQLRNV